MPKQQNTNKTLLNILLILGLLVLNACQSPLTENNPSNTRYQINGQWLHLRQGLSTQSLEPGAASKQETRLLRSQQSPDLDGDGKSDHWIILSQSAGGSGQFVYLSAAIGSDESFSGTDSVLIGDRVQVEKITSDGNRVSVHYRSHSPSQALALPPDQTQIRDFLFDADSLRFAIIADIPGEADPEKMYPSMKTWHWQETRIGDSNVVRPKASKAFTLRLEPDGTAHISTDCNNHLGRYVITGKTIHFKPMAGTSRFCADSQENEFLSVLGRVSQYHFTSRGEFILEFSDSQGALVLH